jgi:hypothetical protein
LSILAGPADLPFFPRTVRHLVRACRFPFSERILVLDTLPASHRAIEPANCPEPVLAAAEQLRQDQIIDRLVRLDEFHRTMGPIASKHFGRRVRWSRDCRGIPLFGWIAGLEASASTYHVHCDSDILLYQEEGYDWIGAGMDLLQQVEEILFIAPRPGPPAPSGMLIQSQPYTEDSRGYFRFQTFSSRRYLADRRRFDRILPFQGRIAARRLLCRSLWRGCSPIVPWEILVNNQLRSSPYVRAHLSSVRAWSLHVPDHGREFCRRMDAIVEQVERGVFPAGQAGHYDLKLELWQ